MKDLKMETKKCFCKRDIAKKRTNRTAEKVHRTEKK